MSLEFNDYQDAPIEAGPMRIANRFRVAAASNGQDASDKPTAMMIILDFAEGNGAFPFISEKEVDEFIMAVVKVRQVIWGMPSFVSISKEADDAAEQPIQPAEQEPVASQHPGDE